MTSRVRVSARSRPFPHLYPHFNRPSGFWACVKSCLVGGSDKYSRFSAFREAIYPIDGTHFGGRDAIDGSGRVCLVTGYPSGLRGPSPQALTLFGGLDLSPCAWGSPFRGMPTGSEAFLEMPARVGFGLGPGRTLKKALCHTRPVDGTEDKYHRVGLTSIWPITNQ